MTVGLLQKENANLKKQLSNRPVFLGALARNAKFSAQVKEATRIAAWPKIKFINDKAILHRASELVMERMFKGKEQSKEDKELYIQTYKGDIKGKLNEMRSYTQSRGKKEAEDFYKHHGYLPTLEEMERIVYRFDIDLDNERDWDIFMWYWTKYLGTIVGVNQVWNKNTMYYTTILEAKLPDEMGGGLAFPSKTEAYGLVTYENTYAKWKAKCEYLKNNNVAKLPPRTKANLEKYPELKQCYDAKYTESDKGQQPFGGFSDEGLVEWMNYTNKIRANKKKNRAKMDEVENEFLKRLRIKEGLTSDTAEEEKRKKRKRKSQEKKDSPTKRHAPVLVDMVDDESD